VLCQNTALGGKVGNADLARSWEPVVSLFRKIKDKGANNFQFAAEPKTDEVGGKKWKKDYQSTGGWRKIAYLKGTKVEERKKKGGLKRNGTKEFSKSAIDKKKSNPKKVSTLARDAASQRPLGDTLKQGSEKMRLMVGELILTRGDTYGRGREKDFENKISTLGYQRKLVGTVSRIVIHLAKNCARVSNTQTQRKSDGTSLIAKKKNKHSYGEVRKKTGEKLANVPEVRLKLQKLDRRMEGYTHKEKMGARGSERKHEKKKKSLSKPKI